MFMQFPTQAIQRLTAVAIVSGASLVHLNAAAFAESTIQYSPPPPPPDQGTPTGRARGGASRDALCATGEGFLTALVPSTPGDNWQEIVWARTVSGRPTFLFYIPYSLNANLPLEFTLKDAQNQVVYQTQLTVASSSPGIAKFTLPETVDPLELDTLYHWDFRVYCHPTTPISVNGWIERIALDRALQSQLEAATPRDRIALYAERGIWYEAIAQLAELRQRHPKQLQPIEDWHSLLESVGLQDIATEGMVECCTPNLFQENKGYRLR